jgi:hypothetical protein
VREHQAGAKTEEVCRRHGISSATFYIYGRLPVSRSFEFCSVENRLQNIYPALPVYGAAKWEIRSQTLLDKWSASRAILKTGFEFAGSIRQPIFRSFKQPRSILRLQRGVRPGVSTAQITRAFLLATATVARLYPRRW